MEIGGQLFGGAIAALGGRDEADLVSLLLRLDQPSRVGRFGSVTSDITLAAHARRALADADWIGAALMDSEVCACVEIYKLGTQAPDVAEIAFVVERRWRRLGIATSLLHASIAWARSSGIDTLRMVFSHSNWAMRKLASKGTVNFTVLEDEVLADMSVAAGMRA
jgi:GNAT superfamily N-acetyltransferase